MQEKATMDAVSFVKRQVHLSLDSKEDDWEKTHDEEVSEFCSEKTRATSVLFFYFEEGRLQCVNEDGFNENVVHVPRMFFIIKNEDAAVEGNSIDELLPHFEFGTIVGNALYNLLAFLRLFLPKQSTEAKKDEETSVLGTENPWSSELGINLQKLEAVLTRALSQANGDLSLAVPDMDTIDLSKDSQTLEQHVEAWTRLIANLIEEERNKKIANDDGPLAEIEFWRLRNASLSALYEQIHLPKVQAILKVVKETTDKSILANFTFHFAELQKLYIEAKDNVKFLSNLERHFKNITYGSLPTILETLPSMLNAMRMVWIISRHYNTDMRLVPLMERIMHKIATKVEHDVNIKHIFRTNSADQAQTIIHQAHTVLVSWESTYLDVRKRIEDSGTSRWEFDRKRLFELTRYMAHVCQDLEEVATVLDQFHKFLGPELKSVTGQSKGIDQVVERVSQLIEPLESVPFNIFDKRYKDSWSKVMENFHTHVEQIEDTTKHFIEQSFQKLRSAQGAFDLVENFKTIQSRESINQQINDRYKDILKQYTKELEAIDAIFQAHKDQPPLYRNFPPVAGAVAWARDLYLRAKKPILRFKAHQGLLATPEGEQVKQRYLTFARAVDAYITELHKQWEGHVQQIATEKLKQPILASKATIPSKAQSTALINTPTVGNHDASSNTSPAPFDLHHVDPIGSAIQSLTAQNKSNKKMPPPPPYRVNFAPELSLIMRESKYLDRMGFSIPDAALNATLQEDKYHNYRQNLELKLAKYEKILSSLSPVEFDLLSRQLTTLQGVLRHGFTPLNWNSQRIPFFIEACEKALNEFAGVVSQIKKSSTMIDEVIFAIENTILIQAADLCIREKGGAFGLRTLLDVNEFYEATETKRVARLHNLVSKYRSIEPLLKKVEEVVATSNNGNSPLLASYYTYWEKRIFNAITIMITKSLVSFRDLCSAQNNEIKEPFILLQVMLNGKDLIVTPPLSELSKYFHKAIKDIVESAKVFIRWKRGSCIECEPQVVNEDEEPYLFTYYQDVARNIHIHKIQQTLLTKIHTLTSSLTENGSIATYLNEWSIFDRDYKLWDTKKPTVEKDMFSSTLSEDTGSSNQITQGPPGGYIFYFDNQLQMYKAIAAKTQTIAHVIEIDFVRIDCRSVAQGISTKANMWLEQYGEMLRLASKQSMDRLLGMMTKYEEALVVEPEDLESLKALLNTIATVVDTYSDVELECADIIERYRTMQQYPEIFINSDEAATAAGLGTRWHKVFCLAKTRDLRVVKVKAKFRDVTKEQAREFFVELEEAAKQFRDNGPASLGVSLDEGVVLMNEYQKQLESYREKKQELVSAENLFGLELSSYPTLNHMFDDLAKLGRIYTIYSDFKAFCSRMSAQLWSELDAKALKGGVEAAERSARKLPAALKENYPKYKEVEVVISNFKNSLPVIMNLKNEAMKERHWTKLVEVTKVKFDSTAGPKSLTLGKVFAMELHQYTDAIDEIVNEAVNELKIENELRNIESTWANQTLDVRPYMKDGQNRGFLIGGIDEVRLTLEDNLLNLQTISGSRFVGAFAQKVRSWEKTLNLVSETLDVWIQTQTRWLYLESIFVSPDIRVQLPDEAKKFDAINKAYRTIMTTTNASPTAVKACKASTKDALAALGERLDACQKSLTDYLDSKRSAFARFYFISDDELLSILGSSDPQSIQQHMLKLFDNVANLHFDPEKPRILGMNSAQKEGFDFVTPSKIDGPVENWMTLVEAEMVSSLHSITNQAIKNYSTMERTLWLASDSTLGMCSLAGSQIWWTYQVEDAFEKEALLLTSSEAEEKEENSTEQNADESKQENTLDDQAQVFEVSPLKELETKLTRQLTDLVAMVRTPLDSITRKKVNTLLIIDVHARDIVEGFVRDEIQSVKAFAWESQLRFYWDKEIDNCIIKQCTGSFQYGYEYMGLNGRLVITPLTDRCYMTLTQALTFKLGGSPAGPAGTGKTETVKDLAKSLALACFVINCGEGLDFKAMGSIFSGLVQAGAWGCFDEFNRISIEVLSVVSAQLRSIQNALLFDKATCDIGMGEIHVKRVASFATCAFFITMNPGYAGRTELPDNLKALFRPVTMVVPDLVMICEIMLFSEGFESAKTLARKMTVLYKLSKEQLSKQFHYDFGLRSLKSVLVLAGGLKRQYSDSSEDLVLMRVLRDSNMPKYVFEDVPLFRGLIADLFPGLDAPRVGYENLNMAIVQDLEKRGFRCSDDEVFFNQVDKIVQLYETMIVRHTSMVVGPTGGGKTLVLDTLKNARLVADNVNVKQFVLNPKAQTLNELYGVMDPVTRDWTDGVLSRIFRDVNEPLPKGKENEMRWIIYDGDVDAVWVENMNSVMDDNKLLTLPNGERIRLQPHCAMICETYDLQYASPATISRCGMIWVDSKNLGYRPFFERWLRLRCGDGVKIEIDREEEASQLMQLFDQYIPKCMDYVQYGLINGEAVEKLKFVVPITSIDLIKQLCVCLEAFLAPLLDTPDFAALPTPEKDDFENVFLQSVLWSLGASLLGESQERFKLFVASKVATVSAPDADSVYDASLRRFERWSARVPEYLEPSPFKFYEVLVPTSESCKYSYILESLAAKKPILFVGGSGTAKTTVIQSYLANCDEEKSVRLTLGFSSRTSSRDVQTNIESNVDKRTANIYGPAMGKILRIFVDDANMPKPDSYGTQQPITFLLTLISRGFIYDRQKELNQKILKDVSYMASMGPPGGGRNAVDPRFVALFSVFNLPDPTVDVLTHIYSSILDQRFRDFSSGIKEAASKLPNCMLEIFRHVIEVLPPTPSKFCYLFTLRDLSRVAQGLCLATEDAFTTSAQLARLFRNEVYRVFADRLVAKEDFVLVENKVSDLIGQNFPEAKDEILANPLIFGDFAQAAERLAEDAEDPRIYKDMGTSIDVTRNIFEQVIEQYNIDNKPMTLVLFEMALQHLTRIHRIIRMPRGNALLVGVGGSGKQSLCKLATYCAGYELFQITLVRNYGEAEFREDLKKLFTLLGGSKEVTFLFTDAHISNESFLEYINNLLTQGVVPALYEPDERDQLCNSVRNQVKELGIPETTDNLWKYYVNKCRNNLHIVLCMSPSGEKLRLRCRSFPGLISGTAIDWFKPWPEDALKRVATNFLSDSIPAEHRSNIIDFFVHSHLHVVSEAERFQSQLRRYYYVTPKNYLDYVNNYQSLLTTNEKKVEASVQRLSGGLSKLVQAATDVDRMSLELSEQKIVVDSKTKDVQELIAQIQSKTAIANEQKEIATVKQEAASEQAVLISAEKEKADEALNEAMPAVKAAEAALDNLHKEDLTEIKNFAKPPKQVQDVCLMLICLRPTGEKLDETWADAKKMLSNSSLLEKLKKYPKDNITEKMMKGVRKYFKADPSITVEKMESISKAGKGLLVWVCAISKYHDVARNVEPLRNKVREMEKNQANTEKELSELTAQLSSLEDELKQFNEQYTVQNEELTSLQMEAALMEKRLGAASTLISGLTGERTRWAADIESLNKNRTQLIGDCLLAANFLSYSGAFTRDFRHAMIYDEFRIKMTQDLKIPLTEGFQLESFLSTDTIIQGWIANGLPADEHSIQNGILTTAGSRFPLCIDPQQQAVTWIKKTYGKKLKVKTLAEADFMKHLELAVQFGTPFLFEGIDEELDPLLDPILEKNTFVQSGQTMLKLPDKNISYDSAFRLFFTTKLANPCYSPEIMAKTMLVNYSVTGDGLANQLLNVVVAHERPELEQEYSDLVTEMSSSALLIVQLEDTLLRELSSSTGNILDNEELIVTLSNTQSQAASIKAKLEKSASTKNAISIARSGYSPVAKRGSILYFLMASLATINEMYETSLDSFLTVFNGSLRRAKKDRVLDTRLRLIIEQITNDVYNYTCTGIFERHKLMFSFQLACMIQEGDGKLARNELDFFLRGDTSLDAAKTPPPVSWLTQANWKDLLALGQLSTMFTTIVDNFDTQKDEWKQWYDLEAPEESAFPTDGTVSLTQLQRLCVMRCIRPDRVYNAVKLYIIESMGEKFVQPPTLDYNRIYLQSTAKSPVVFILSPGADPQADIQILCQDKGFANKFKFVALGQGQGPKAEELIEQGTAKGYWVMLMNCHLLVSWLKKLEKHLELMKKPHKDFRLWLTTEPTSKFPLGILQRSLKVVTEPPDGLRLNIRSTYSKIDQATIDECPHPHFRQCLFVLAWLHGVVQERRKFGKIGWNVAYDFNESDFQVSRKLLSLYLSKAFEQNSSDMPWGSLKYLIGDAMYGGRVSDDMDRRVLKVYLEKFMGDFLFNKSEGEEQFYFSQAGFDFYLPQGTKVQTYTQYIDTMPLTVHPAVFGLHANAEIGFYTDATKHIWSDLISLQPRSITLGDTGLSRDELIAATAKDILDKVPVQSIDIGCYDLVVVRNKLYERNGVPRPTPCQVVLLQELERWNALVIRMATTLSDLLRAFKGEIGMSEELDSLGSSLFDGFLPKQWRKLAPDTDKKLGSWMTHFLDRHKQYEAWILHGEPAVIWLSGLHVPESYLTALVQTTCRAKNWPLDKSAQFSSVTKYRSSSDVPQALDSGTYVTGLYLEGAGWDIDRDCLVPQEPKVLVVDLPILQVVPIEANKIDLSGQFIAPVYVTQRRRNAMGVGLVFTVMLQTNEKTSHWVLQGVALTLNTDA